MEKLVEDAERYDNWQPYFIGEIIQAVKRELEASKVPKKKLRDLTESIAFSVACIIDGSQTFEVDGEEIDPILTFSIEENELIHWGGNSSLHEYVHGVAQEIFEEEDAS